MQRLFLKISFVPIICLWLSCSGQGGTGVSNPPTNPSAAKLALAIGALFGGEEAQANISALVRAIKAQNNGGDESGDPCAEPGGCTCVAASEPDPGDYQIQNSPFPPDGFILDEYGAANQAIAYDEESFCINPLTEDNNTGSGPDGQGLFAFFELTIPVEGRCTEFEADGVTVASVETIEMGDGSFGLWRNTGEVELQIYGRFRIVIDGEDLGAVDCTLFIETSGSEGEDMTNTVVFSVCTDESGAEIDQDLASGVCTIG